MSNAVSHGLHYVSLKMGNNGQNADAIADRVLLDWLKAQHPDIMAHLQQVEETEKMFKQILLPKK